MAASSDIINATSKSEYTYKLKREKDIIPVRFNKHTGTMRKLQYFQPIIYIDIPSLNPKV